MSTVIGCAVPLALVLSLATVLQVIEPRPTIALPEHNSSGRAVGLSPDGGTAYYVNRDSVSVIDLARRTVTATVAAPISLGGQIALTPAGDRAYVTQKLGPTVSGGIVVIDLPHRAVLAMIPARGVPAGVDVSPDGRHAYVTFLDHAEAPHPPTVGLYVINTATEHIEATIGLGDVTDGPRTAGDVRVAPDGRHAYVADGASIRVIDATTSTIAATLPVPVRGSARRLVIAPDGRHVYVAIGFDSHDTLLSIDTATYHVQPTTPATGREVEALAITSDGRRLYLSSTSGDVLADYGHRRLLVVDPVTGTVQATVPVPDCHPSSMALSSDNRAYLTWCGSGIRALDLGP